MPNQKISQILFALLFVSLAFGCQSPSSTNGKEDENENPPALSQNFALNKNIGAYRTRVYDGISVDDGIVVLGSYRETSGLCDERLYLLKLDYDGNEVWLKKYDNLPTISACDKGQIIATQDQGFLVTAVIENGFQAVNRFDLLAAKVSPSGNVEWTQELDYTDFDWYINGFQHANGNFILYPTYGSGGNTTSDTRVTIDQNGTIVSEESHSDFTGILYSNGIDITYSGNIIFRSSQGNGQGTIVQIRDKDLNPIVNSNFSNGGFGPLHQPKDSQNGYFVLDKGRFVKYNDQLEEDWKYEPAIRMNRYSNPVSFSNIRYGVLEVGVPNPVNNNPITVLSILEEGGGIASQGTLKEDERIIRRVTTDTDNNIIVISWSSGLLVESYSTGN